MLREPVEGGPSFSFHGSQVGQVAGRDITNVSLTQILDAAEAELNPIEADEETREAGGERPCRAPAPSRPSDKGFSASFGGVGEALASGFDRRGHAFSPRTLPAKGQRKQLSRQWRSARPRQRAGELGEDGQVGMKPDALKPTDPER